MSFHPRNACVHRLDLSPHEHVLHPHAIGTVSRHRSLFLRLFYPLSASHSISHSPFIRHLLFYTPSIAFALSGLVLFRHGISLFFHHFISFLPPWHLSLLPSFHLFPSTMASFSSSIIHCLDGQASSFTRGIHAADATVPKRIEPLFFPRLFFSHEPCRFLFEIPFVSSDRLPFFRILHRFASIARATCARVSSRLDVAMAPAEDEAGSKRCVWTARRRRGAPMAR